MTDVQNAQKRILRGSTRVVSEPELNEKLRLGRPLRIKLGVDPTAPDIHLGHTVVLNKLRLFQDLGHTVVFIIGDFTAAVGDPSGRDSTRPPLSDGQIEENTKTYTDQVFHVLDKGRTEVRRNSEWLYGLFDRNARDFLPRTLLRENTVQQLMERDDFTQRRAAGQPISLLELMYPLFQGYDSVAVQADVEIGGNDQIFNLLMGRELQKRAGQPPQVVMTLPLLEGLDGVRKMSKSYANHVGLNDPAPEMFGKIMSVSDALMWKYFELLTEEDLAATKALHPMEAKKRLAGLITKRYHGADASVSARAAFENVFSKGEDPSEMEEMPVTGAVEALKLVVDTGFVPSKKEAKRLLDQGGVQLDGRKLTPGEAVTVDKPAVLKVGKRRFKRLVPGA